MKFEDFDNIFHKEYQSKHQFALMINLIREYYNNNSESNKTSKCNSIRMYDLLLKFYKSQMQD